MLSPSARSRARARTGARPSRASAWSSDLSTSSRELTAHRLLNGSAALNGQTTRKWDTRHAKHGPAYERAILTRFLRRVCRI
ncbi:hypothetical protein Misp03_59890 [Microbispora sp. NBRC 16548]|nr:hypothetical protein Misp03_59890 [Microbispora sp. NBRC 16548]